MKVRAAHIAYGVPILLLVISYCLAVYLFVAEEGLLENQIGRITAVIDLGGIVSIPLLKKLLKRYLLASLWVGAFAISVATGVQTLAGVKLHGVLAKVTVLGESAAVDDRELRVQFLDSGPQLSFHSKEDTNIFVYRTGAGVLRWDESKTVLAVHERTGARDSAAIDWPPESIWDIGGKRVVELTLELELKRAQVKVVVDPADASVSLTTYHGEDTTGDHLMSSGQSQFVSFGDKVSIRAWCRGYYPGSDDLGLDSIRSDTEVHLTLIRKPSDIKVEAYNMGGVRVDGSVVYIDGERTEHRAFEKFELPWGRTHGIAVEFVREPHDTLRSETQRVTLRPDELTEVKCTLQFVH